MEPETEADNGRTMGGEGKVDRAIFILASVIEQQIPDDVSAFVPMSEDEKRNVFTDAEAGPDDRCMRLPMNPVDMMMDLAIAMVTVSRACGVSKKDVKRMLASVFEGLTSEEACQAALQLAGQMASQVALDRAQEAIDKIKATGGN